MITVAFYLIASDDMKKELDTTPLLDILDRRKSMQDAVVWARRALQRIRPGVYRRSTRWSIELSRVASKLINDSFLYSISLSTLKYFLSFDLLK